MFTRINVYQFRDEFTLANRKGQFSYEALGWLFDYLEQCEEDTGEPLELDVIALCCDYNEDTFEGVAKNYNIDTSGCDDEDELRETVLEYLHRETAVCGYDGDTVLYACF